MKVVEHYYGPKRHDLGAFYSGEGSCSPMIAEKECYIRVEVNGRMLHVRQFFPHDIPSKIAMRECQRAIMHEVEREVFGG